MFTLQDLQNEFNQAETNVRDRIEGLPIFGYYKKVLQEIMNLEPQVFEMLYDEDISDSEEYELEDEELIDAYKKLEEINRAG